MFTILGLTNAITPILSHMQIYYSRIALRWLQINFHGATINILGLTVEDLDALKERPMHKVA